MRALVIGLVLATFGVAMAQQPAQAPPPERLFSSNADVQALIAKTKADLRPEQPQGGGNILSLAPYRANLEYRRAVAAGAVHETEAEIFYVIDGSGVMTTGGKLKDERRTNPSNLTGTGIEGGKNTPMAKGDWMIVPEGTPHWVSKIDGTLIFMTLHIPRPLPAK